MIFYIFSQWQSFWRAFPRTMKTTFLGSTQIVAAGRVPRDHLSIYPPRTIHQNKVSSIIKSSVSLFLYTIPQFYFYLYTIFIKLSIVLSSVDDGWHLLCSVKSGLSGTESSGFQVIWIWFSYTRPKLPYLWKYVKM
jgi:hypothetical protein